MASTTSQHPCSLTQLPAELRNKIYRYALVAANKVFQLTSLRQPALLAACRQIRSEATPIFFAENTFDLHVRVGVYGGKPRCDAISIPTEPAWMAYLSIPPRVRNVRINMQTHHAFDVAPATDGKLSVRLINFDPSIWAGYTQQKLADDLQKVCRFVDGVLKGQDGEIGSKGLEYLDLVHICRIADPTKDSVNDIDGIEKGLERLTM